MTDHGAPPDAGFEKEAEELAALVSGAKNELPSGDQLANLGQKLGPMLGAASALSIGAATSGGAAPVAAKSGGAAALAKVAGVVVACSIAGGGAWLALRSDHDPKAAAPRQPTALESPSRTSAEPLQATPVESAHDEPAPPASSSPVPSLPPAARPSPEKRGDEAKLLRQAQSLLKSDPGRALALTSEHRRRFPKGVLSQERDVIAIEALAKLGRGDEAKSRAREFSEQHPGSAHGKKVEAATRDK